MAANGGLKGIPGPRGEISVVVSPLLNLAPSPASATSLNHHRPLRPLRGGLSGAASLALSPDRRTLDVKVVLDRPRGATLSLRRVERLRGQGPDEDLLIVVVEASEPFGDAAGLARRFSLERREAFSPIADTGALLEAGIDLSEFQAGSVAGVELVPAWPAKRGDPPRDYLSERMMIEIAAAESSATPIAARRHVELAILYARELGAGTQRGASGR